MCFWSKCTHGHPLLLLRHPGAYNGGPGSAKKAAIEAAFGCNWQFCKFDVGTAQSWKLSWNKSTRCHRVSIVWWMIPVPVQLTTLAWKTVRLPKSSRWVLFLRWRQIKLACGVLNTYRCSVFGELDRFGICKPESQKTEAENESSTNQREADGRPPTAKDRPLEIFQPRWETSPKKNISSLNLCA